MHIRRVLFPTDYSEGSALALPVAVDLARRYGAELVVLHVTDRRVDVVPVAAGIPPVELESPGDFTAHGLERLSTWVREQDPNAGFIPELAEGVAAEEILALLREDGAQMVVMGTTGHSKLERFLLGSVTEDVLRGSPVPVLAVPFRRERV